MLASIVFDLRADVDDCVKLARACTVSTRSIAGMLAGIVAAACILWLASDWALSAEAARWARQAETRGWTVSWTREAWGGWPLLARLSLERAAIAGGSRDVPGGLAWSADRAIVSVSIFHPLTLRVAAEGQQFLRLAHAPDIGFVAGRAVARLPLWPANHGRGTLRLADVTGGIAGSRYPQDVRIGAVALSLEADKDEATLAVPNGRLSIQARNLGLPDIGRWPLGATISSVGTTILLESPAPRRAGPESAGSEEAAWRDAGGAVRVREARLRWGPLALDASADLSLDDRLQPAGTGTVDARGTAPTLDAATQAGLITPGLGLTAKAILAAMTHVETPDGDAVRLPFLLKDSTVSVGQIPLTRLPQIRW